MPLDALALALAAALLHALWNMLTARADGSHAALAVAMVTGALACAPVAVLYWDVDGAVLPYLAGSVVFELGYLTLLATAYGRAPMSVVYPVARGAAPVIVARRRRRRARRIADVRRRGRRARRRRGHPARPRRAAVEASAGRAARGSGSPSRRSSPATRSSTTPALEHAAPIAYLEIALAPTALLFLAGVLALQGAGAVRAAIAPPALLAGIGIYAAYGLALLALARAPRRAGRRRARDERRDRDGTRRDRHPRARRAGALGRRRARRRRRRGDRARGLTASLIRQRQDTSSYRSPECPV